MKNPNGYGTVVKLSGKRRRPYAVRITEGWKQNYDRNGMPIGSPKQKIKYLNYYENRKDALYDLAEYNRSKTIKKPRKEEKKVTSPTFLEMWHITENNKSDLWADSTYKTYRNMAEKYAEPIHDIEVSKLDYSILQQLMNDFMAQGKTKGVCKLFKGTIRMILNEAIKLGHLTYNPMLQVRYKGTKEDLQKRIYDTDYIKALYHSKEFIDKILLVLVYTGLRINELLKLEMRDVHLEERYLIAGSKTDAGKNRTVPIHNCLVPIFVERMKYKYFTGDRILSHSTLLNWKKSEYTFHEARHTFISLCDEYDLNHTSIKRIVGHSTKDITDRIYTHKTIKQLIQQIDKLPFPDEL